MTVVVPAFPTPVPTRDDPVNFPPRADDVMRQFPGIVTAMNEQNAENNAINGNVNVKHGEAVTAAATATSAAETSVTAASTAATKAVEASGNAAAAATAKDAAEQARDQAMGAAPWPAGTRMLFVQSTAPVGWTKVTTHNNAALRVVSGSAGSGGTINFTTAFSVRSVSGAIGNTTLTTGQIPAHSHSINIRTEASSGSASAGFSEFGSTRGGSSYGAEASGGAGGSHTHTFTGASLDLSVKYVDSIIAEKD